MGNDKKTKRQKSAVRARHGSKRANSRKRPIDRPAPGIPPKLKDKKCQKRESQKPAKTVKPSRSNVVKHAEKVSALPVTASTLNAALDNSEILYDTGKMGTPEHRAKVEKEINEILKQYPWITRSEAMMINIQRGVKEVSMRGANTSGGGRATRYFDFLKRKYGKKVAF